MPVSSAWIDGLMQPISPRQPENQLLTALDDAEDSDATPAEVGLLKGKNLDGLKKLKCRSNTMNAFYPSSNDIDICIHVHNHYELLYVFCTAYSILFSIFSSCLEEQ